VNEMKSFNTTDQAKIHDVRKIMFLKHCIELADLRPSFFSRPVLKYFGAREPGHRHALYQNIVYRTHSQ
jgi:hypothetical protein